MHALILPPVYFTVADFGADFAGTITVSPETSVALLRDVCVAAAKKFRAVAIANIHLEPRAHRVPQGGGRGGAARRGPASAGPTSPRSAGSRPSARPSSRATTPAPSRPR